MNHPSSETFDRNVREALADEHLRGALQRATDRFGAKRQAAVSERPDWEEMREEARAIKEEVLTQLDHYLEQFVEHAEAAGAQVHWARDGREACRVVGDIADHLDAGTVVKSKSMTTEEIRLNEALQKGEHPTVETDLGEWIIQLAEEPPSHILPPPRPRGGVQRRLLRHLRPKLLRP